MSETWHGDSYVEEQESLANSIAQMTPDVQSSKLISNKVVTEDLTLHISPTGDDTTGDGTQGKPFFSLNRCCEYINSRITAIADGGIVFVKCAPGVYDYSQIEQEVSICKAGLKIQIKGQAIKDVDVGAAILRSIQNGHPPAWGVGSSNGPGYVKASIPNMMRINGTLDTTGEEYEVDSSNIISLDPAYQPDGTILETETILFKSKRTTFNVGSNMLFVTGRNTRCDLLNLKVIGSSSYAIGLQEVYCNQFMCIETVGGVQVSNTHINMLQECIIDCTNNGSGFAINNRSDVKLNQGTKRPTLLVIGNGISVMKFSTFDTSSSYVVVRNADTGLSVGFCSMALCGFGSTFQYFTFENCTTNTVPNTVDAWSSNMGYIS